MKHEYITRLNELIANINEKEIRSHLDTKGGLEKWCAAWKEAAFECSFMLFTEISVLRKSESEEKTLYIKVYTEEEPEDMAEKIYQICDEDKFPKVVEMLNEILTDQEDDSYADAGMPDQYDNMTGSMNL